MTVAFDSSTSTDDTGIVSYTWDFGDGNTSDQESPVHTYADYGSYEVTLTVTDAEGLEDTVTITVNLTTEENTAPVAIATWEVPDSGEPLTVAFDGSDSTDDMGIVSYAWDFGDGNTSDEISPVYTYADYGSYEVTLTVTDAEGLTASTTLSITVTENIELDMILSPNPSVDYVEITLNGVASEEDIIGFMIHDSAGRLIRQFLPDEIASGNIYVIPLQILTTDVYVVTAILRNEEPISKRLILNR